MSRPSWCSKAIFDRQQRRTQGRFGSLAMDEDHLIAAVRYVALNPVRARLVARASEWPHSSVRAHMAGWTTPWSAFSPCETELPISRILLDTDRTIPSSTRYGETN